MAEVCGDNRFEIIEKAKQDLIDATNISSSPDEMKVLDSFLYRCWQMGWLDHLNQEKRGGHKSLQQVMRDTFGYELVPYMTEERIMGGTR